MKILHVIPGLTQERGGPTAVIQALVRAQAEANHRVTVLTTDQGARHGETAVTLHPDAELVRLAVRGPDRLAYAPRFTEVVRSQLRACDVLHVHSIFTYPVHAALRESLRCEVPVVLRPCGHLHSYSLRQSRWRKQAYLTMWGGMVRRACTAWHYTSAQEAAESWPHDASCRFVLPNGIDPAEFALDRPKARETSWRIWPQLDRAPYVLFLGRIHPKKRLDLLLEAFLSGAPAPCKLAVAGPDECGLWRPLAARFLKTAANTKRVVRLDTVSGPVKAALLAGASLFALPSEHENFGIAPLEALAAGTSLLLSPHVAVAQDLQLAGLCDSLPLELGAWRLRLNQLLSDPDSLEQQAGRARAWVRDHYAWSHIAAELIGHYQRLATSSAGTGAAVEIA